MSGSVVDRLRTRAASFANNVAVVDGAHTFTYEALFRRVDAVAAALHALGLRKGDAVLLYLGNQHEAIEAELAILSAGLVLITLTSRLTYAEVRGVAASCAPKLVVTTPDGAARLLHGQEKLPLPAPLRCVVTGAHPDGLHGMRSYEALVADALRSGARAPGVAIDPEDTARLRYTSGTTGGAKAAVLPHRVYHASLDNLLHELAPLSERDGVLHVAPLTHASGALVYPALHAGARNLVEQRFDPDAVLDAIERERLSILFTVPTILTRLAHAQAARPRDVTSLRALIYGGAPMPAAQVHEAVAVFGRALLHIYGMTEAPWPITTLRPAEHAPDSPRVLSVGRATTVCEVRVCGVDGAPLAAGAVGELEIRGRNVMRGYHEDDATTRAVLREGGWLRSGDLGYRDDDGYVFIVGRSKDVIISGGFNVYATEVEAALATHEGVLECAVLGAPHEAWGEEVVAFVVAKPGVALDAAALERTARELLSGYKVPRRIEIVAELPKTPTGKIMKSVLRERTRPGSS